MNVIEKKNTPLLQAHENDNSHAASVDQASGSSEDPAASPLEVAAADAHLPAETPTKPITNQTTETLNRINPVFKRYFNGENFPRFLIIKHQDLTKNIATENYFKIADGFEAVLSERQFKSTVVKYLYRSRHLLVEVDGRNAAAKILALRTLGNIPVSVEVHRDKNSIKGVIRCRNLHGMSDAELLDRLSSQHVTEVFNFPNKSDNSRSHSFVLTFSRHTLPDRVYIWNNAIPVEFPHPNPRQCSNCREFGHGGRTCRKEKVCDNCGQSSDHDTSVCPNEESCCNCGEKHPASSKVCPLYQIEEEVIRYKQDTYTDFGNAREHVYRTHAMVDRVPRLKQRRDRMKPTTAQVVARKNVSSNAHTQQQVSHESMSDMFKQLMTSIKQSEQNTIESIKQVTKTLSKKLWPPILQQLKQILLL